MCSSPLHGHVSPLRELGAQLVERGHRVAMLTGRKYAEWVQAAGLQFLPLPSEVDFDDAALDDWLPGRDQQRGLGALRHDMVGVFVRVIPGQHRALREAIAATSYDAVIGEFGFTGMLPLLLDEGGARPPVVGVSIAPLTFSSADTAPFGT